MEQQRIDKFLNWVSENKEKMEEFSKQLEEIKDRKNIEKYTDLIIEMKEAMQWYMDNCTTVEKGRTYDETFFNLGANLITRAEEILER